MHSLRTVLTATLSSVARLCVAGLGVAGLGVAGLGVAGLGVAGLGVAGLGVAVGACGVAHEELAPAWLVAPLTEPAAGLAPTKVHALEAAAHPGWEPREPASTGPVVLRALPTRRLTHKVYGYYPYWSSGWQNLRFELLSTLAYFSSGLSELGVITSSNGWGGASVNALVTAAKQAGVRVVQTITNFDNAAVGRLLADPARRNTAINSIIAEVSRGGGQGVNIDFEFVPVAQKATFVTFMRDLTTRMHAAIPGSEVTLATPSVDWTGAYDYDQLALHTDGMMIMAYGYHWTGGPPGPLAPLVSAAPWSGHDLTWTVNDYLQNGATRDKLILGLPFYGTDWPTTSATVPGTRTGNGHSVVYKSARLEAQRYGRRWDAPSSTPYYVYQSDGGWRQAFYDDGESFDAKLGLIKNRGLAGVGIWALAYDGDRPELFDAIERQLSEPIGDDGGFALDAGITPDGGSAGDGGHIVDGGNSADAGLRADAGSADAADAGTLRDGGAPRDGGPIDAGSQSLADAGTLSSPSGGCAAAGGGGDLSLWLLAGCSAAAFLVTRRRRR